VQPEYALIVLDAPGELWMDNRKPAAKGWRELKFSRNVLWRQNFGCHFRNLNVMFKVF